jgi:SAM-dependent methyltransferase
MQANVPGTFSRDHLEEQRRAHAVSDGYGRHHHFYLDEVMRDLATRAGGIGEVTWLDYGCGKGTFIERVRPLGLFSAIAGFDPAVAEFAARPVVPADVVTCLDVLDTVEPQYREAVLREIAGVTRHFAVFDCVTRPKRGGRLLRLAPGFWAKFVGRVFDVVEQRVEYAGMEGLERVVLVAAPRR